MFFVGQLRIEPIGSIELHVCNASNITPVATQSVSNSDEVFSVDRNDLEGK
jgi:hypothetical protein